MNAVLFLERLESEVTKYHPNTRLNKLLDILLNNTFLHLLNQTERILSPSCIFSDDSERPVKKIKTEHCEKYIVSSENDSCVIKANISKLCSYVYSNKTELTFARLHSTHDLNVRWKFDTLKCVDATPLLLETTLDEYPLIFIGSHSKQFVCLNGSTGDLIWKFLAKDRIESSACLSKCGNFVIVGMAS